MPDDEESSFKQRAIESLMRHGFPLEIETHQKLETNGWKSRAESAFEDPDEEKTRRVDFLAWKKLSTKSKFFDNAVITLLIECKKRENSAWVFYRTEKELPDPNEIDELIYRSPMMLILGEPNWVNAFDEDELRQIILNSHQLSIEHPFVAIAGHDIAVGTEQERKQRIKKKRNGKIGKKQANERGDFLYKASIEVTKALEAQLKIDIEHWIDELEGGTRFPPDFEVYYPVVVFDGQMYEAHLLSGEIELDEVPYVQLVWEMRDYEFTIDVVSKDYFDSYLKTLNDELVRLGEIVESLQDIWDRIFTKFREILFGEE